ncbi:OPT family oligopeptide transporter [Caloramator proteoclasticus]|uniref:Putative oligopeptide transporter, OPT family n=1 Tax=Caloramator proteoclasticus DSM 10124 TaxID=1121262 RepID=A0A1M4Y277_9CLOT|nr:oligopeptide transporter, OPT family [Caloramator proteoclasticus]SHE99789.1 putative oligopeptide transporter, OPT family [Caloramator proteoclasticus DSM 10124]
MSRKGLPDGAYGLKDGQKYVPYVPSEKKMPEFTVLSIILGVLLSALFGAANAYLGLKVGMTVSASIPAAVVSMAIVRVLLRRKSILENNMVQTIASAGESLAAGAIFTIPALFLWGEAPSVLTMGILTFVGGALGVLFMIPVRRYLIVQEHGKLPYPEGVACAEVLVAGEEGGTGAIYVFIGALVGLIYKLAGDGFMLFPTSIDFEIPKYKGAMVGMDVYPALLGVGFIVGPQISAYMLGGAILGWLVLIPAIYFFGQYINDPIFPASVPIKQLGIGGIWKNYIRYIGAGAVATGGIVSLIKAIPTIVNSFRQAMKGYGKKTAGIIERIDTDLNPKFVIAGIIVLIVLMAVLPQIPVKIWGAVLIAIFGFFFVTVSSRIVGLVGSSSNPVSGMTIATLLFSTVILKAVGYNGKEGMIAALIIGAVVCTAAAIAGDISQDLKTGYLVGATPWKQQIGELIGVLASAAIIGFILIMLHQAYTFGSKELSAPQATLMKLVIEGIMDGNLPWNLVFMGVFISLMLELFKIPSLPVAIGLYLPISLSTPIMVGGIVRGIVDKKIKDEGERKEKVEKGILYSSGLIAGEGLMGVILAFFAYFEIDFSLKNPVLGRWGALILFLLVALSLAYFVLKDKKETKQVNKTKSL